jgi:hypothetical protein
MLLLLSFVAFDGEDCWMGVLMTCVLLGTKWLWMSLCIDYMLPISVCMALISFDWASVAFMPFFISPERLEWAVLSVTI